MSFWSKLRMIKKILNSHDVILITYEDNDFTYWHDGDSLMFVQLFQRLVRFIPNWKAQWHHANSIDEKPVSKMDLYMQDK